LFVLFAEKGGFMLTLLAGLNIALYLSGYIFRLQFMTRIAKSTSRETNYRFFIEEMLVAMLAIMILPVIFPIIGYGNGIADLVNGWAIFARPNVLLPALLIGGLYGCLYLFGTRIYLNRRENTFCIPINRCASLLAGVAASFLLTMLTPGTFLTATQLVSASILFVAILFLSAPQFLQLMGFKTSDEDVAKRTFVFVCPGNTSRSPMAQAICEAKMRGKLKLLNLDLPESQFRIISAGIDPQEGKPISDDAATTLAEMGIEVPDHQASRLSKNHVKNATMIFCMSDEQRIQIVAKFPEATLKCLSLDPASNIPNPHGQGMDAYRKCAGYMANLINHQIEINRISWD
jgi:protein-tyrosine-phosphatase